MSIPSNANLPMNANGPDDETRISDATHLSDATHISDATHLSDATHITDVTRAGAGHGTGRGTASTTGPVPAGGAPSLPGRPVALPAMPAQPRQAGPAGATAAPARSATHAVTPATPAKPVSPVQPSPVQPSPVQPSPVQPSPVQPSPVQSAGPRDANRTKASPIRPAGIIPAASAEVSRFQQSFDALVANVSKVVVGKETPIRLCVTALLVGGHVLLEDNPGTGKTQLARGLANSIKASFKRIQFTPDLLPSDVTGITFYDQKTGDFTFREGPVFASIVLADEINRASPKTQSALLEVMEEQKVTVDGVTHPMPQPFIVIATQNPIEQLGTYKLPEAQMDRFLIKTSVGYPDHEVGVGILRQMDVTDRAGTVSPVLDGEEVLALRGTAERVHVDDAILEYIMRLVEYTRASEKTVVGSSMRGALALTRCARIWAAADGRGYVVPDDVKDLAVAVLSHRVTLTAEATFAGETPTQLIEQTLHDVPAPTLGA